MRLGLVLVALACAGCLAMPQAEPSTDAPEDATAEPAPVVVAAAVVVPPSPIEPGPRLVMGNATAAPGEALKWSGEVAAKGRVEQGFLVEGEPAGPLVVMLRWPLYTEEELALEVQGPDGTVLASADAAFAALGVGPVPVLPAPGSAAVVVLDRPAPGAYVVAARAVNGSGPFEASAVLRAPDAGDAARDLLPNLVTLPPMDLRLDDPFGAPALAEQARGCGAGETAEKRVVRCLRFSNGVGNVGEGPLEMRLPKQEGPAGLAGEGRFAQRVWRADGSYHDAPAGRATFHPYHGHFHYSGAAAFRLHAFDLATGARGPMLKETRKTGFCFGDLSLVTMDLAATTPPTFDGTGCLDPLLHDAWVTGLTPNWYDRYHWSWFDQYVDLTGVPDGAYELVSVVNEDAGIQETRLDDNEASAVFRLKGSTVEMLWTTSSVPAAP